MALTRECGGYQAGPPVATQQQFGIIFYSSTATDWALNTPYTLIDTTGGVFGAFTTETFAGFNSLVAPTLTYTPTQVQLLMLKNGNPFVSICETYNQCSVADAVDDLPATHPVTDALASLPDDETVRAGYDNLSGEIHASMRAMVLSNRYLRDAVSTRARNIARDERLWASTWGFDGRVQGGYGIADVDHGGAGLVIGADGHLGAAHVGAVFSYEDERINHGSGRRARSDVETWSAGGYVASEVGGVKLHAGALYGSLDVSTRRNIWIPTLQGETRASYRAHKVQVFAEAAREFQLDAATLTPYAEAAQIWLKSRAVRESADGQARPASLFVQGDTLRVTQTTVGVRAAVPLSTAWPVVAYGDLGWLHTFGDVNFKTRHRFAGTDKRFPIRGTGMAKNTALAGAGVQAQLGDNAVLTLGYQGEFSKQRTYHAATLQVRVRF